MVLIVISFWLGTGGTGDNINKVDRQNQPAEIRTVAVPDIPLSGPEVDQAKIKNMAMTFAERFGTFSNTNDSEMFLELKPMMTESFFGWVGSQYQNKMESDYYNQGLYASVVTEAVSMDFVNWSESQSEVLLKTRRVKNKLNDKALTFEENLRLKLVKTGDQWLIDAAYWEKP